MKNFSIIVLFMLLLSCGNKEQEVPETKPETADNVIKFTAAQLKNAGLTYGKMEQKDIASILKVNGIIDVPPQNMVSISVPMGGYLKKTHLLPGMHVKRGEIIATVEDPQYIELQQEYLLTKSKLNYSQLEYNRQKELNKSKASSDKVVQMASSELNNLRITLGGLTEKLKLIGKNPSSISQGNISKSINIYAPIDGFVTKVNVNVGKYISPTDVMFELVDPSDIHLALKVFEKDINKLYKGQKLVAFTNSDPERKFPCEVLLIGKDISPERSTDVHCHFESYDKTLIPGTYMNAEIAINSANHFVLPEDAVVSFENKHYVFLKKSEATFEMVEVQIGEEENGFVAIANPEKMENETFVINGAYTLLMSLKNVSEE